MSATAVSTAVMSATAVSPSRVRGEADNRMVTSVAGGVDLIISVRLSEKGGVKEATKNKILAVGKEEDVEEGEADEDDDSDSENSQALGKLVCHSFVPPWKWGLPD